MWELLDVIGVVLLTFTAAILIVWHVIGSTWTWGPDGLPCVTSPPPPPRTQTQLQQDCSLDLNDEAITAHCSLLFAHAHRSKR